MAKRTITRKLEFDYGHRLIGHESKCSHLHGHRGLAEVKVTSDELDSCGRVIDFSKIKEVVGGWIDLYWDHNMILCIDDPLVAVLNNPYVEIQHSCQNGSERVSCHQIFGEKKPYILMCNPTAENMVEILAKQAALLLLPYEIQVVSVRLYETPNCWADFSFED